MCDGTRGFRGKSIAERKGTPSQKKKNKEQSISSQVKFNFKDDAMVKDYYKINVSVIVGVTKK